MVIVKYEQYEVAQSEVNDYMLPTNPSKDWLVRLKVVAYRNGTIMIYLSHDNIQTPVERDEFFWDVSDS